MGGGGGRDLASAFGAAMCAEGLAATILAHGFLPVVRADVGSTAISACALATLVRAQARSAAVFASDSYAAVLTVA
jgi:hypothetical protein